MLNCTAKRLQEVKPNTLLVGVDMTTYAHVMKKINSTTFSMDFQFVADRFTPCSI